MSKDKSNISPKNKNTCCPKPISQGDGIKETVMRMLSKYPGATPEQIGNQCGIQPELVARIIDADRKRKMEGY